MTPCLLPLYTTLPCQLSFLVKVDAAFLQVRVLSDSVPLIVTQLTVFLLPAGANCGFLIDICSAICSDLCWYVVQPFLQDGRGRPFLSRQSFIALLAPSAFRWTSARRSAMTHLANLSTWRMQ
ncbi:hypothetical protein MTO96_004902 [Rhipicephalus appendiculatus]